MTKRFALIALVLAGGATLGACNDGYGYGGVSVGYADSWDPYYGGFSGDPYWGWYGDRYYPGTGVYVYDRDHRRHRWDGPTRDYWNGRGRAWHDAHRDMRPMWRDFGGRSPGSGGGHWGGRPGGGRPDGHHPH